MEVATSWYENITRLITSVLGKHEETVKNVVLIAVVSRIGLKALWMLYDHGPRRIYDDIKSSILLGVFRWYKRLPYVQGMIDQKIGGILQEVEEKMLEGVHNHQFKELTTLPQTGLSVEEVKKELDTHFAMGKSYLNGKISGVVYHGGDDLANLSTHAFRTFIWSNPLHPDVFPGVRKMEAEVIAMTVKMFNGDANCCGSITSGGTESILMACKTHRDWAKHEKGITKPEMVVPESAHAAFDKAADYFKIKIIHVAVDPVTRKADVRAMRRAITSNTIMVVASVPSYPHGVIDDVEGIARIAVRYGVGLHVDSCLGGFLVPFMDKAGFPLAPFDFRVKGVTSISCDTHKYGYAPKGTSVVLYNSPHLRQYQYFVAPDWPGGIYACPTVAGSRPGALVAGCWATMAYIGEVGYVKYTKDIVTAARKIAAGLKQIYGIYVLGEPEVSVVALGSDLFDIYRLADALSSKGWVLNCLQYPSSIHICLTVLTVPVADKFVEDVGIAVKDLLQTPSAKPTGAGAMYGMAQAIPDRSLIDYIARGFIDTTYKCK